MVYNKKKIILFLLLVLFLVVTIRKAWLADDAFITFRVIDNWWHGYGLTWNIIERVQAYTHPLWLFTLAGVGYLTRDLYHTTLLASLSLTAMTFFIVVFKIARGFLAALVTATLLLLSKAFTDYSTSGLENALTYFIVALYLLVLLKGPISKVKILTLAVLASLATLNRLDNILILGPSLFYEFYQYRQKLVAVKMVLYGFAPLFIWELFSIIYYGYFIPNTAWAKLNTGIGSAALAWQGLKYLTVNFYHDSLTILVIILAIFTVSYIKQKKYWPLAVGLILYLAYVVKIGGDFMVGRFLAVPLLVAVVVFGQWPVKTNLPKKNLIVAIVLIAVIVSCLFQNLDLTNNWQRKKGADWYIRYGITDEQGFYYSRTGWLRQGINITGTVSKGALKYGLFCRDYGNGLITNKNIGLLGYYAGPRVYIIDNFALADPLLARLPAIANENWRIGHFSRVIPPGYLQTANLSDNKLADPDLARYYDQIKLVTRGPLWRWSRFLAIYKLNIGLYDHFINKNKYRYPETVVVDIDEIISNNITERDLVDPRNRSFFKDGFLIDLKEDYHGQTIELAIISGKYQFIYLGNQCKITLAAEEVDFPVESLADISRLKINEFKVPKAVAKHGYDHILIKPVNPQFTYTIGNVNLTKY